MPLNTTYNPLKTSDLQKDKVKFNGQSINGVCLENTTTDIDLTLTEDHCITGGVFSVKNGDFNDKIYLQVVHPVYGVVDTFVNGYGVVEDEQTQFNLELPYPAKLPGGLKIRCKYVASGRPGGRQINLNCLLHKVLV